MILYRATNRPESYAAGSCFSPDEETAEAYLDNPGFGGAEVIAVEVDPEKEAVLSLVDGRRGGYPYGRQARYAWNVLAEAIGEDEVEFLKENAQSLIHNAIDSAKIVGRLREANFEWVVYEDTFPAGAVTWVYLGEPVELE
jgi:hypothetical protein